jgi:hypothetical protein
MEGDGSLTTLAQIALALAGFTGIVIVFQSPSSKWRMNDLKATEFIFEHTFGVAFLSLLPFPLAATFGEPVSTPGLLWRVASAGFALCTCILAGVQAYRIVTLRRCGVIPRKLGSFIWAYFPLSLLIVLAQVGNIVWCQSPTLYLWALLLLLFAPGVQFWFLVQFAVDRESRPKFTRRNRRHYKARRHKNPPDDIAA